MSGKILLVDDTPANIKMLSARLGKRGYTVWPVNRSTQALEEAKKFDPDIVLMDINMPNLDGYDVCEQFKTDDGVKHIPILFLSTLEQVPDKLKAFGAGGIDYATRNIEFDELLARIDTHITIYHQHMELQRQHDEIVALREKEKKHFEEMNRVKDEFVQIVTHDLKSPITRINTIVSMLKQDESITSPDALELIRQIQDSTVHMYKLIATLLDLTRIEAGIELQKTEVQLNDFLYNRVMSFQMSTSGTGVELKYTDCDPECTITVDPFRMEQVLTNLLSNAVKYSPDGGCIEVFTKEDDKEVTIVIKDSGLGIPEKDIPNLFNKFFRVREKTHMKAEGTGLGLSIVKAIVEQHGGRIWVESKLGEGSTFFIALPK